MRYSSQVRYEPNTLGKSCITLSLPGHWVPRPFPNSPLWSRMHQVFDPEHFLYAAPPVDVGKQRVNTSELSGMRALRCPVKPPGSSQLSIPSELAPLRGLIEQIVELEVACNPRFQDFWAHVSFERTAVRAGATQRVPGWHVDGFQGVRVPRHQIEHSYLWADIAAAEFCLQPFFVSHLDPARHNVFDELAHQARSENAFAGLPEHIYLIDPYVVHRSPVLATDVVRSVFRLTFTETELEDPVNTVNLSLPHAGGYRARTDVRDRLFAYEGEPPAGYYGLRPLV